MTDEATNNDIAAAALDVRAPDAGQDPALDPAAIDTSTVASQPLAFIAPDDGTQPMTDEATNNDTAAAALDASAPDAGQDPALDPAAIDSSTIAPQPLAFIAPDDGTQPSPGALGSGQTVRVSTDAAGGEANGPSFYPAVSRDLRYVAFESTASNLVPDDTNGKADVFVKDLGTGQVTLVSADAQGNQGNSDSYSSLSSISATGRTVAFDSFASNLVPDDTNAAFDVFVKDLGTGQVTLASADAQGNQGNASSVGAVVSGDGRTVAFTSYATNLVPDGTKGEQVFVKDLGTGEVTLASADADGTQGDDSSGGYSFGASLSDDGHAVAFTSTASNLVPGDTNRSSDVFVKDLDTGQVTLASANADGTEGNYSSVSGSASLSGDGRFVAFSSFATNLLPGGNKGGQVFVKDLGTGQVTLASADADGNAGGGFNPAISPDGRYVSFTSNASNLVADNTSSGENVFVKDLWSGEVKQLSDNTASVINRYGAGQERSVVADTGAVAFNSLTSNVDPGDANSIFSIFLST